jgi:Xaa-Pro aminopeptidase
MDQTERLARVRSEMRERAIDMIALAPSDNLRYVLGFAPFLDERACMLLLSIGGNAFVVPSINAEDVKKASSDVPLFVWEDATGPLEAVRSAVSSLSFDGAINIAVDPEMRADAFLVLQSVLPGAEYFDGALVLQPVREVKSDSELELLRASAATADVAMQNALDACRHGVTELEVAEAAVAGFRSAGVNQVSFTIIGSGPNGAFPHHHTSERVLVEGDAVVVDLGGRLRDYSSDITRMAFIGEPTPRYREAHGVVNAAVAAASRAVKPGVTCGEVDAAAREVIADAGYGEYFVHRTGHGLGLSMHEPPWIIGGSEELIREGMVFSIEPGIYLPGEFGLRLEEIVDVTSDGCTALSALPRDVRSITAT